MAIRTGTKQTPNITLSKDQLTELISRTTGVYTAYSVGLEGDEPVRISIAGMSADQRRAALDALTIETTNGVSFGLDSNGNLTPGSSAWFGYIYGNADRIVGKYSGGDGKALKWYLSELKGDELESILVDWIRKGTTPNVEGKK